MTSESRPSSAASPLRIPQTLVCWGLLTAILWCWSLARVPIPGVNEPHYLTKARHYWDPAWCHGDLFLESSNPHLFFYATLGRLTTVLTLEQAAFWGRLICLAVVAWGWWQLCCGLVHRTSLESTHRSPQEAPQIHFTDALAPLAILLLLQASGTWSGEWLVGGIESKVLAYGCTFWGLGSLLQQRWLRAAIGFGLAVSFHPLVGGWSVLCAAAMLLWDWRTSRISCPPTSRLAFATGLFLLTALPGTIPALQMILSADPVQGAQADYLMVTQRLSHHLDPMSFPGSNWRFLGFLLAIWSLLRFSHSTSVARRRWETFTLCAVLAACVGVLIAWGPRPWDEMPGAMWRVKLLKFYPFRLADLLVPMAVAFELVDYLQHQSQRLLANQRSPALRRLVIGGGCALTLGFSAWIPGPDQHPSGMQGQQLQDWITTCRWIDEHAPQDALLFAANERSAVKWYAQRPEFVNYKDCPQDAASLMVWNDRLWQIETWKLQVLADFRITRRELDQLHAATGITHLITSRLGPIQAEPVFQQGPFSIYALGD
ncbi:MAG: hypothetical protein KDA90_16850 [Planctomycetaceae bacterium]|nr:hypothetical protein [Planctomycetaceae bacterium]